LTKYSNSFISELAVSSQLAEKNMILLILERRGRMRNQLKAFKSCKCFPQGRHAWAREPLLPLLLFALFYKRVEVMR
jgi:hypothetical protein